MRANVRKLNARLGIWAVAVCVLAGPNEAMISQAHRRQTSVYSNTRDGISFRYPARFALKQGDLTNTNDIGLGYMGPLRMAYVHEGGRRIATVEIPAEMYRKTDFVNAFFSVSVNDQLTSAQCEQFDSVQSSPRTKKLAVGEIVFTGIDDGGAGLGHQFGTTYYHSFVGGRCYELSYGVATAGCGAIDGITCVSYQAIMARLEAIVRTVQIVPPGPAPTGKVGAAGAAILGSGTTCEWLAMLVSKD